MKIFILSLIILIAGCRHREQDAKVSNTDRLKEKLSFYCSQEINPYSFVNRCDGLTFIGLYDAYCKRVDIYRHEYPEGKWNRDVKPCYPKHSRSAISFESQLGAIHACWSRKDLVCFKRMKTYAENNDWVLGEGPLEYVKLNELSFVINKAIEKLSEESGPRGIYDPVLDKLKGYRGKVIADYISIKGDIYGYLNEYEMILLKILIDKDPKNPIYNVLYGKYTKDGQKYTDKAIEKLLDETVFPRDNLPGQLKEIDWGNNLGQAIYAWTVHILDMDD